MIGFFHYPTDPRRLDLNYCHEFVVLAQGLAALNVPFESNVDYWDPVEGQYLLKRSSEFLSSACKVVLFNSRYWRHANSTTNEIFARKSLVKVLVDSEDGLETCCSRPDARKFNIILKCHFSRHLHLPSNVVPWAFGLAEHQLDWLASGCRPFADRQKEIIAAFRCEHDLRRMARPLYRQWAQADYDINTTIDKGRCFSPVEDRLRQLGRGNYASFCRRLLAARACSAFGGELVCKSRFLDYYFNRLRISWLFKRVAPWMYDVFQWDSWRFWESLAAGCVTMHIDLERAGAVLPVMPVSGVHYLGVDVHRGARIDDALLSDDVKLTQIAQNGRAFAIEHYSPMSLARKLLQLINV